MTWLVVAALLAADDEPQPSATVWAQPLGALLLPLADETLYVSLGSSFVLPAPHLELAVELTGWQSNQITPGSDAEPMRRRRSLMVAVGPLLHTGATAFGGFFIEPKLVAELGYHIENGVPGSSFGSVQLGATGGWQLRWKLLYLAVCLGASVGVGNRPSTSNGPLGAWKHPTTWGFQYGVDFNLLRIGVAL